MGELDATERMALTVARSALERGENPGPNTTGVLVMALERIANAEGASAGGETMKKPEAS